jgi:predicted ATPase
MNGKAGWGIPRHRVVAVVATLPGGQEQFGSGFLVGGCLVLTAEHCTRGKHGNSVAVRLRVIRASDGSSADVTQTVACPALDVAVLKLADTAPWPSDLTPPSYARVDRTHSGMLVDCEAIGYPLMQRDPDKRARNTAELHGTIYQTDEAESGRLLMREPLMRPGPVQDHADSPERHISENASPWGGLSGAIVFYRGLAIAVVVEHHPRQGDSALRALAFDTIKTRAESDASAKNVADTLGLSTHDLPLVIPEPVPPTRAEPSRRTPQRVRSRSADIKPFMSPPETPYFVGRDAELASLRAALDAKAPIVIHGLYGMGGVGKTTLAIKFSHNFRSMFPDGILWAQLDKASTKDIFYAFAHVYGRGNDVARLHTVEARISFIRSLLAGRRILVILDNATKSDQVEPLLRATAGCPTIVTTRSRDLAVLRDAVIVGVNPLSEDEALELLKQVLGSDRVEHEKVVAGHLCTLTGNLPLAIRIIAERAKRSGLSLRELASRLEERRNLDELRYGRERSKDSDVRASFDISYQTLSRSEQLFFSSLGVFGGVDFDSQSAAYVANVDPQRASRQLEELSGLSLVDRTRTDRYRLHSLLREYAKEKLLDDHCYDRMLSLYISLAEQAEPELRGPRQSEWLHRLDTETTNIQAALRWAAANGRSDSETRIAASLMWFWSTRGYLTEARRRLDHALSDVEVISSEVRAKALRAVSFLASNQGDFEAAKEYADEAVTIGQYLGDFAAIAEGLNRLAYANWCLGDYAEASSRCEDSLGYWRRVGNKTGIATSLNISGLVAGYEGEYQRAASLFRRSVKIWREEGDQWGLATSLNNLGEVLRCLGRLRLAGKCYTEAIDLRLELGDKWSTANSLNNLGELMRCQGQHDLSLDYYRRALRLASEFSNNISIATSLSGLGGLAAVSQEWARAAHLIGKAESLLETAHTRLGPANNADHSLYRASISHALESDAFEVELRAGARMSLNEVIAYALEEEQG